MNRRLLHPAAIALVATLALAACQDKTNAATPAAAALAEAPPTKATAQEAYALAAKGSGFTVGPIMAANTVYVFFDTACPHCAHLWEQAKPLQPRLKIVWMPIGLLRSTSGPQGATILSAADPAAAMAQNEASVMARGPGIAVNPALPDDVLAKVKNNTALFNQLGAESVPLIVFKNGKTGVYGTHAGAVDTGELAAMAGI
ncbi:thioredoxin fold domain-containing protein [Ideonella sp. BN130291]|uniref:thioredoxin fold domain-containing protein n=1 Tax=Ideonella sp. BN130291 TaxID=3112940 RepID=UPI002E259B14|nr:thioredoxin fold domain-containing protein [Ideonella sp. BN130291]